MSFAATAAAVIGAGSAIYMGSQQRKQANKLRENAVDPGIQPNYALDRVSNTLFENYNNYNLPGYSRAMDQMQSAQATANRAAIDASTSSADILSAITRNEAVTQNSIGQLDTAVASGKEQALMRYLDSVAQQGQDQVRVNNMELQRYDAQLREAAALQGSGIQNQNSGFQDALTASAAIAGNFTPRTSINQNTGEIVRLPSVWQQLYGNKRNAV